MCDSKMKNIIIEFPKITPLEQQSIELVERKGIGHPDSICDGLAESVSRALSKEYLRRFGKILHHNTDQVELVGGEANSVFGGGEVIRPIYILLSGRATTYVGNERIPVGTIAIRTAREYLKDNLKNLDVNSDVILDQRIGQGSADLRDVFGREGVPKSNDTSFGVGFAPLSTTEKLVLETERYIGKLDLKEVGEDVKVMGVRNGDNIILTIADAMVSGYIPDIDHYKSIINDLYEKINDFVVKLTDKPVKIDINAADDYKKKSVYLTVTGTSAEHGDDGSVGRGNRANGLITPYRPMSVEASAGKNPVNHVGKIYNLLSKDIAEEIAKEGCEEVCVRMMSQIGSPINKPLIASVQIIGDKGLESKAREIVDYKLENITDITKRCVEGKLDVF